MLQHRPTIAAGDLVIVYEHFSAMKAIYVKPGQIFNNKFGAFPHKAMIGRRFGEKHASADGRGFVHLLPPTPELWTGALPHRTQILYIADISMICLQLELLPGARVIEAGTGSGSLSHALARSVGPTGCLYTYEFNEARAKQAKAEFAANQLAQVTSAHGDVCVEGWAYDGIEPASIDAVIFDLPQPWDAIARVAPFVRPGGRLCCFSPCIEQVARSIDVLPGHGFTAIETIEVLVKTHDVRAEPTYDPVAAIVAQSQQPRAPAAAAAAAPATAAGEPAESAADGAGATAQPADGDAAPDDDGQPPNKRQKPGGDAATSSQPVAAPAAAPLAAAPAAAAPASSGPPRLLTKPFDDMRGHTGFLLFCTKHVSAPA